MDQVQEIEIGQWVEAEGSVEEREEARQQIQDNGPVDVCSTLWRL